MARFSYITAYVLCFIILLALAGCGGPLVRADAASFTDPAYRGQYFPSLVVQVEAPSLTERQQIERAVVAALHGAGVMAVESAQLLPPTRDYSRGQVTAALRDSGMRGVLVIAPQERQTIQEYVPPVYHPPRFDRWGSRHHPIIDYQPGYYQGGYYIRRPRSFYNAAIFRLPGYDQAWTAELRLEGANRTDFQLLDAELGQALTAQMIGDRIIIPAPAPF